MRKAIGWIVIAFVVGCAVGFFAPWESSKEKVQSAQDSLKVYKDKYDATIRRGESLEAEVRVKSVESARLTARADSLERVVDTLESGRQEGVVKVANLFQPDELVDKMKTTFPELKEFAMGVARVPHPVTKITITVFQVPLQSVATFISDHEDMEIYRRQKVILGEAIDLHKLNLALKDTIISLEKQKADEYLRGLEYGMKRYEDLTGKYIDEANRPKLDVNLPTVSTILGAAAVGVLIGTQVEGRK
ncbi:MAG: hypothetical protein HY033_09595 [Ignavibacteriae bacterium]|nr:hypothetical protein [Ignavibacteriota bacterium]